MSLARIGADRVLGYRICGLAVASAFELRGAIAGHPDQPPEVVIRRGAVPESLPASEQSGPTWQIAGAQLLLDIPGIARFLMSEGREIVVEPASDASLADIPIFILGTAFGILLHQRGQVVLHAAAVQVGDYAVLLCGPSGAGKSTLAAALAQLGHAMLCDDVCALEIGAAGAPRAHPDGQSLKLWAQAINRQKLGARRGERVRPSLLKFHVEPAAACAEALPIGAIYVLREARPPFAPGIDRANVVDAAVLVRRNAYRPLLVGAMDQAPGYFHAAARLAGHAGVFHLTRPLDFAAMPDVTGSLEAHWDALGLTGSAG